MTQASIIRFMVERSPRQSTKKENPQDAYENAKNAFNSSLMGEYNSEELKAGYSNLMKAGSKIGINPENYVTSMITFGEQATQKATIGEDTQSVEYFVGVIEGLKVTLDVLSPASTQKSPASPRSMNQAKS
jgi:hypothetical protein